MEQRLATLTRMKQVAREYQAYCEQMLTIKNESTGMYQQIGQLLAEDVYKRQSLLYFSNLKGICQKKKSSNELFKDRKNSALVVKMCIRDSQ